MKNKIFPAFLAVLMLATLSACTQTPGEEPTATASSSPEYSYSNVEKSTDVEKLQENWLPKLEGIESAVWEQGIIGENSPRSVPGPSTYFAWGFITLTPEQVEKYRSEYSEKDQWLECDVKIPQSLQDNAPDNQHWQSSVIFSMEMSDKAYVDIAMNDDGIIFFSARD